MNALTLKSKPRKLKISFIDRKKPESLDVASCYLTLAILQNKRNSRLSALFKDAKVDFQRTIVNFVKIFQFFFIVGREELLALFIFSSICLFINPFVIKSSEFVLFLMKTQAYIIDKSIYYSTIRIKFRKHKIQQTNHQDKQFVYRNLAFV